MAVAADGRFALLPSKPATLSGRKNLRVVKFCNGELMGKKLKFTKFQLRSNVVRPNICMSLTTDVAGEAKVSLLHLHFVPTNNILLGFSFTILNDHYDYFNK